jgi:hypothetical protein
MRTFKYLTKGELEEANRQAIKAGSRAIALEYIQGLPENFKYPIFFTLPWERHGWVRCQVGTGSCLNAEDYTPVFIDVPRELYESLGVVEIPEDEAVPK